MVSYLRLLTVFLLVFVLAQGKPLEGQEGKEVTKEVSGGDEMMEVAESQNPFLPRFAMRKLKERREKARAERRNQGQRRFDQRARPFRPPCPYYKK